MKVNNCIDCDCEISEFAKRCEQCKRKNSQRPGSNKRKSIENRNSRLKAYKADVVLLYGRRCAICKWRVVENFDFRIHKGMVSDSQQYGNQIHHIIAVKDGGGDEFSNLILLCPNHHKQADCGVLTIEELKQYQVKECDIVSTIEKQKQQEKLDRVNDNPESILNDLF